jgi:hypothetical protein
MKKQAMLGALALVGFVGAMTADMSAANAVVCARGVYRAGCVGPRGAVVAPRPVYRRPVTCRWVWVNGVRVRRCV